MPFTLSGGVRYTHYFVNWLTRIDAGVMLWAQKELRFTEGGQVANFRLKARPNRDTVGRTIAIAFGDGSSAPSATGIAGGVHILGGSSVSVDIVDDDEHMPVVSIAADGDVTEGEDASFTVTASPAPPAPMWVRVRIAQTGDFLVSSGNTRLFKMPTSGITQLTINTTDDYADEADGSVTASVDLFDLHSYEISQAAKTATVAVADNDDPPAGTPEISITADGDVTEGSDASFTVSSSPAPAVDLDVSVAVTQSGDYGATTGARTVTIPTSGSYTLTIATTGDGDDEADGAVTATLNSGAGYTVSSTAGTATVAVADDDPTPEACNLPSDAITVSVVTGWREEYSAATHQSRWNRVLEALGEDTGSGEAPMTAAQAVDIKSQINNDRWDRTVRTLQALEQCDDPPPAMPEISISAGAGVTEGNSATFTITASPAPQAALPVSVSVTQSGDFGATTGARRVTIPTGGTYTLTIATTGDSVDEADGSVTATLNSGTGYTVSSGNGAATVAVSDDDDPLPATPEISITAGAGVTEGGTASFTITASPTPASALTVGVTVSQSGDYGATTGAQTVTIPTGSSYTLTVSTSDDSTDEADGSVTASVNTGTGYTVSSTAGTATVAVADDDPMPQACNLPSDAITVAEVTGWRDALGSNAAVGIKRWNRVLAAFGEDTGQEPMTAELARQVANWLGNTRWDRTARTLEAMEQCDSPPPATPEISIAAGTGVTEGSTASFTITASPTPASAIDVSVSVTQSGDFGATTGAQTVTIPTGGSYTLTVATSDDSTEEADGSVTATLNSGTGYAVSSSNGAATVVISDNDDPPATTPEISIAAGSDVTEGSTASFTITASPPPAAALSVNVTVSQSGDYSATTGTQTVSIPTSGSYTLTVATSDDSTDEADGSVTATVNSGSGYTVSTSNGAATVAVSDDDVPEISISSGGDIIEGSDAIFTITASPPSYAALPVNVTVSQSGDYSATTGTQTVSIPTSGSYTLTVATSDDSTDEADGSVTATVNNGSGYTVSTSNGAATVAVSDDDDPPAQVCNLPDDAITADEVTGWRDALDPTRAAAGVKRWNRVLEAFGIDTGAGVSPMTATQAQDVANWLGNTRWDRTARTLEAMEQCDSPPPAIPSISISAGSGVTEGSNASFTITASPTPAAALDVSLTVSQSGDFGATTGAQTVTIPTGGSYTLTVATSDDSADEADGSVTATLNTGSGYTVSSSNGAATVVISDNDDPPATKPEISIAAGSDVTEGSTASFTLTASPTSQAALSVNVTVSQSGDYGASTGLQTVSISTSGSYTLTVTTSDDSNDEADGSVTATVNSGTGYTVSSSNGAATVAVSDDDPAPQVCVLPSDAITVVEVTGWRDEHSAATHQSRWNRVLEALGEDTGSGESPMTAEQARDIKSQINNSRWDRTSRTLEALEQCDSPPPATPEISIIAGAGVTEGSNASFTITASPTPASALDVGLTVSQSGDFGATTGAQTVIIPTSGSYTLTVATSDDSDDEADGSVTATLNSGTGYTVSSGSGSATVAISDDDDPLPATPEISITAGSDVTEGSTASFIITASPTPQAALSVRVTVSQSGDYGATIGARMVTIPTSGSYTLTIATTDDSRDEADGSVTATVNTGTGYTVSATAGAATVAVADDDVPEISITADGDITEGGNASFTFIANPSPRSALSVSVAITQSGEFGVAAGSRTITIPTTGSYTLAIATDDDSEDESEGSVTATVNEGSGYTVLATAGTATVNVADDDEPAPESDVTISVADASGPEGGEIIFKVTLSKAVDHEVRVRWETASDYDLPNYAIDTQEFWLMNGWLTFDPGDTEEEAEAFLNDDTYREQDEAFSVKLSQPTGATIADGEAIMTIIDDD